MRRSRDAGARTDKSRAASRETAASLAIDALSYMAGEPEQMSCFLALTGIDPGAIRSAAREPNFLAGVLDHVCGDERLLTAFAAHAGMKPADIESARQTLAGHRWERDVP